MANVKLINYTGMGVSDPLFAAKILVFTKSTRLKMDNDLIDKVSAMTEQEINEELDYMSKTIPSSWEFVDLTFLIEGVTRATAQQITRTRTGSYAMQSQRAVDVSQSGVLNPYQEGSRSHQIYADAVETAKTSYRKLTEEGELGDARGVLPMNIECNLVAKYNLRSFAELIISRKSLRTQGEYADIADQMFLRTIEVWPWSQKFFASGNEKAIEILTEVVEELGIHVAKGPGWSVAKAIDLIRKG